MFRRLCPILVIFFLLSCCVLHVPHPVNAQSIPIYYQLLFAFQPTTFTDFTSQVLGVTTSISPSPTPTPSAILTKETPLPIGGDGQIITIALLGDSMIDTLKEVVNLQKSLETKYPGKRFRIINFGVGASNIEYALFRLTHDYTYNDQFYPNLVSQKPDIIIVESFAYNNFGNSQIGFDRQWQALGNLTGTIKQNLPKTKIVIAATIAPNSVSFANGIAGLHYTAMEKIEKTTTIKLYLENAINFATSQNFPLANAYQPSLIQKDGDPQLISSSDHLHPSALGAQFFENVVFQAIVSNKLIDLVVN